MSDKIEKWQPEFCDRCELGKNFECKIIEKVMDTRNDNDPEYPPEWSKIKELDDFYNETGEPLCLAFKERKKQ